MHLGTRVSALLDGQLPPAEAERAWSHVHSCHVCRDLVEREGWIKTQLSGLSGGAGSAPSHLKGALCSGTPLPAVPAISDFDEDRPRRVGMVLLGGSAAGMAVLGVLALGVGLPGGQAPGNQAPVTNLGKVGGTNDTPRVVPGTPLRPAQSSRR